jgi:hypothetical protein
LRQVDLRRSARGSGRRHAFRNHVKDAGIIQIGKQNLVEGELSAAQGRVIADHFEIGGGQANFLRAKIGAGANPILRRGQSRGEKQEGEEKSDGLLTGKTGGSFHCALR